MSTSTMDLLLWQNAAKVVSVIDIVLSCIELVGLFMLFCACLYISAFVSTNQLGVPIDIENYRIIFLAGLWVAFALISAYVSVSLWVSTLLLNATNQGENDHRRALHGATIWRYTNIFFLTMILLGHGASTIGIAFIYPFPYIIFRIILIYIVSKFSSALEITLATVPRDFQKFV